jgi:hypothetical protein
MKSLSTTALLRTFAWGERGWVQCNSSNKGCAGTLATSAGGYQAVVGGGADTTLPGAVGGHSLWMEAPLQQSAEAVWGGADSLFPLPVPARGVGKASKGGRNGRGHRRAGLVHNRQLVDTVLAVNEMAWSTYSGRTPTTLRAPFSRRRGVPSKAQTSALQYIGDRVGAYRRSQRGLIADGALLSTVVTPISLGGGPYQKDTTGESVPLTELGVALPVQGATVPLLRLLPQWIQDLILDQGVIRIGPPEASPKPALLVANGEYPAIIERMVAAGMVELRSSPAIATGGCFGRPKPPDAQRFLYDGRRPNARTNPPPRMDLPSPYGLGHLACRPGSRLYLATSDLSNFFHMLRMPDCMRGMFGLPPVMLEGKLVYPHAISLPMGFNWAPSLAQHAHVHGLRTNCPRFAAAATISSNSVPHLVRDGAEAAGIFIDDVSCVATTAAAANELNEAVIAAEISPVSAKKTVCAAENKAVDSWGIQMDASGDFRVAPSKALGLTADTVAMLDCTVVTLPALQNLLGRWLWVLLLVRSTLSQLDPLFHQVRSSGTKKKVHLWRSSRSVLRRLLGLLPLLAVTPGRPTGAVLASDASSYGGGGGGV